MQMWWDYKRLQSGITWIRGVWILTLDIRHTHIGFLIYEPDIASHSLITVRNLSEPLNRRFDRVR